jgi:hypothetical protein
MSRALSSRADTRGSSNMTVLKQCHDQEDASAQYQYGVCLRDGKRVSIDLRNAAYYFKACAHQGNVNGQCCDGVCRWDPQGLSIILRSAA